MTTYQFQFKRGTSSAWAASTVPLGQGEPGYDTTVKGLKMGDGSSLWPALVWQGNFDPNVLNPKRYGAKGDGTTSDDTAFANMQTDLFAGARNDFNAYGDYRLTKSVRVTPGTYLFNSNGSLIGDVVTNPSTGLLFDGGGPDATTFVFNPSAANGFMMFNNDKLYHIVFMNCSFHVTGTNAASATLFKSYSTGHAQSYTFINCIFSGTSKWGLALTGSNNNSEMKFTNCKFHMNHPSGAFLYSPAPGSGGSDQFVNHQFRDCDIEHTTGDFIQMASGGSITIDGGSLIHQGDGTVSSSTQQRFVSLLGATHDAGCGRLAIKNVRVEHRHYNSQLLYSERARGVYEIDNVDTETQAWILAAPANVKQIEIVGSNGNYPHLGVTGSMLMGKQVIHYGSNSYTARSKIDYDRCEFVDPVGQSKKAVDYFTFTADGGTGNAAGAPVVRVRNSRSTYSDNVEVFDTNLNWHTAINTPTETKSVVVRSATGGLPSSATNVTLPLNSVIRRIRVQKDAGGTSTATNVTYTLTNATPTTIAAATTSGAAWNTLWGWDSDEMFYRCNTDAKRTLTLTPANITESPVAAAFIIDYQ